MKEEEEVRRDGQGCLGTLDAKIPAVGALGLRGGAAPKNSE